MAALVSLALAPAAAGAQEPGGEILGGALRVFLDCNTIPCDVDRFRSDVDFVNWVRDRTLAQVHLIITRNQTGGGGGIYALDFVGLETLEGSDDALTLTVAGTDTDDEVLSALSRVIGAGLARYTTLIGRSALFEISSVDGASAATDRLVSAAQVDDPWDFWVFEISADLELSGEETERQREERGSFGARRTTEAWKIQVEVDGNFSQDERELEDGSVISDDRTTWNAGLLAAYSLADHWSLGVIAGAGASTRRNQDFGADAAIALEYSFLPYVDAPRRSLTLRYDASIEHFDWEEETVFFRTQETRPRQQLRLQLFQQQPWGETRVSLDGRQFLDDLDKWGLSLSADIELRIVRGLELEIEADAELIEDQIFISRAGLTDEEILLGRFERPTDYGYDLSIGLSFEFGSIYNNVVNNRFARRRGFGGF